MPKIHHPMRPGEELDVSDHELLNLAGLGLDIERIEPDEAEADEGDDIAPPTEGVRRNAARPTTLIKES